MNQNDLLAMTKQNLVNLALSLTPPITLDIEEKKGDMVAKILKAHGMPTNLEPVGEAPSRSELTAKDLPKLGRLREMNGKVYDGLWWKIKIMQTQREQGDVDVCVNGWNKRIKRDTSVYIEEAYVAVLEQAVIRYTVKDPDTNQVRVVSVARYPLVKEGPFKLKDVHP